MSAGFRRVKLLSLFGTVILFVFPWFKFSSIYALSPLLIWGLLALSYDFILGKAGIPSFAQAIPFGLAAIVSAEILNEGYPLIISLVLSSLVGAASYSAVGGLIRRSRGIYYAILTLTVGEALRVTLTNFLGKTSAITVGVIPELSSISIPLLYATLSSFLAVLYFITALRRMFDIMKRPKWLLQVVAYSISIAAVFLALFYQLNSTFSFITTYSTMSYTQSVRFLLPVNTYFIIACSLSLSYFLLSRVSRSPVGSIIVAIRENQQRAEAIGYNTYFYQVLSFAFSGFFAGLSGGLYILSIPSVSPDILGVGTTFTALISVIVGGIGTLVGPIIGGVIVGWLLNYLSSFSSYLMKFIPISYQSFVSVPSVILGILYITIIFFMPNGIYGTWLLKGYKLKRKLEYIFLR